MICILYVNAVGLLLGIAALLVERALPGTLSRRWIWTATIALSMAVPSVYQANHRVTMAEVLEHQAVRPAVDQIFASTSLSLLDPAWWDRLGSYDTSVQQAWFTGSALIILLGAANAVQVALILRTTRRRRKVSSGPVVIDDVPVVVTDNLGPATVGILRSRVLIPRWVLALPGVERQYVLRHEDEHRRAHDGRLLFLMSLCLILVPWNLALWWQLRRLYLAVEVDCDNRVVAALGNAPAYGELLFKVAQAKNHGAQLPRLQPALLGGAGMLERRLRMLLAPTQLRQAQKWALPIAACILLFIVLSMPHPFPSHEVPASHPTVESSH